MTDKATPHGYVLLFSLPSVIEKRKIKELVPSLSDRGLLPPFFSVALKWDGARPQGNFSV